MKKSLRELYRIRNNFERSRDAIKQELIFALENNETVPTPSIKGYNSLNHYIKKINSTINNQKNLKN